jgi:hypothetical protein
MITMSTTNAAPRTQGARSRAQLIFLAPLTAVPVGVTSVTDMLASPPWITVRRAKHPTVGIGCARDGAAAFDSPVTGSAYPVAGY